jgi:hypothetical protein
MLSAVAVRHQREDKITRATTGVSTKATRGGFARPPYCWRSEPDHAGLFKHRGLARKDVNEDASEHPNLKEKQRQRATISSAGWGTGRDHHEDGERQDKEEKNAPWTSTQRIATRDQYFKARELALTM